MAGESLQDLQNRGQQVTSVLSTDLIYMARISTGEDVVITPDNFSGLSASTAETITAAWSFTDSSASFGGILSSNLVDKSAAETVSGIWSFGAGILVTGGGLNVNTGLSLKIFDSTDTDSLGILHDGTDVLFFHTGTTDWNITGLTGINLKDGAALNIFSSGGTNSLAIQHTATNLNFTFTNTAGWNITGILGINAGTVDADFDAISGTSFGGVLEANLLDKSATETITGALWTFSAALVASGGFGVATTCNITDGATFQIFDSTNTDKITILHDGTDLNFTHAGTTDWNITGITSIQAGTVDADFDAITATSFGGITSSNLVDKSAAETVSGVWSYSSGILVTGGGLNVRTGLSLKVFDSTNTDSLGILHDGTDILFFHDNTTEWNITGIQGINLTTPSSPDNNTIAFFKYTDSTTLRCVIWSDGDLANHDGVYGTISDRKLKTDITDEIRSYRDDIKSLKVRKYRMKSDIEQYGPDCDMRIGFIHDEVKEIFPSLAPESPDFENVITGKDEKGEDIIESKPVMVDDNQTSTGWVKSSVIEGPILLHDHQQLIREVEELTDKVEVLQDNMKNYKIGKA